MQQHELARKKLEPNPAPKSLNFDPSPFPVTEKQENITLQQQNSQDLYKIYLQRKKSSYSLSDIKDPTKYGFGIACFTRIIADTLKSQ